MLAFVELKNMDPIYIDYIESSVTNCYQLLLLLPIIIAVTNSI